MSYRCIRISTFLRKCIVKCFCGFQWEFWLITCPASGYLFSFAYLTLKEITHRQSKSFLNDKTVIPFKMTKWSIKGSLQMFHLKFFITFSFYRLFLYIFFLFFYQESHVIPRLIKNSPYYVIWNSPWCRDVFERQGMLFARLNLGKPSLEKTHMPPFLQFLSSPFY